MALRLAPTQLEIEKIAKLLLGGGVVALPTETVYGLAGSIASSEALVKIFRIKKRPFFDPLIVHVLDEAQVLGLGLEISPLEKALIKRFWPGPLTLLLEKSPQIPDMVTSGLPTVAVRSPAHPLFREVLRKVGHPLAAPSANRFGRTSPSQAEHVCEEFPEEELLVLDGGDCSVGIESTVIRVGESDKTIFVYRPGGISIEEMKGFLKEKEVEMRVEHFKGSETESPGQLKHHYQPDKPLVLIPSREQTSLLSNPQSILELNVLDWVFKKSGHKYKSISELSLPEDPILAARVLYSNLRQLSKEPTEVIIWFALEATKGPSWLAIRDRLQKASSLDLTSETFD